MRRTVKNEKMGERYKISLSVHELIGNHDADSTKIFSGLLSLKRRFFNFKWRVGRWKRDYSRSANELLFLV